MPFHQPCFTPTFQSESALTLAAYKAFARPAAVRSKTWKQPPKKPARKRRNLGKKLGGKRAAKRQMLPQPPLMAPETAAVVRKMRSARRLRNSRGSRRSWR
jgi:hypothetical protein